MGSRANLTLGLSIASVAVIILGLVAVVGVEEKPRPSVTPSPETLTEPPITATVPVTPPVGSPTLAESPTSPAPAASPTSPAPAATPSPVASPDSVIAMTGPRGLHWIGIPIGLLGLLMIRHLRRPESSLTDGR